MALRPIPPLRMHEFARSALCRCAAWLLLAVVVVAIVGVPIPAKINQIGDEPYPCQRGSCGCASAGQCWDRCCCHSDEEKLAWAKVNDVTPPVFLVERVAKQQFNSLANSPVVKSCCASRKVSVQTITCKKTSPAPGACCSSKPADTKTIDEADTCVASTITMVRLEDAAQCRGMQVVWTLLSSMVIGLAQPRIMRPEPPLIGWLRINNEHATSYLSAIDPPVPWVMQSH
jgi:hypothetical protein